MRCERCGKSGYVLLSVKANAMLCAMCHHGGPKKPAGIAPAKKPIGGKRIAL